MKKYRNQFGERSDNGWTYPRTSDLLVLGKKYPNFIKGDRVKINNDEIHTIENAVPDKSEGQIIFTSEGRELVEADITCWLLKSPKLKMIYYLVEAGFSEVTPEIQWFDLIRASSQDEAQRIADSKEDYGQIIEPLSTNFRESIGQLVYDKGYRCEQLKPISMKYPQ